MRSYGVTTNGEQVGEYTLRGEDGMVVRFLSYGGIITDIEVPGIWIGRLVLENLDGAGSPVGQERNAYQVVTAPDGTRRIAVSTPLDAYASETAEQA